MKLKRLLHVFVEANLMRGGDVGMATNNEFHIQNEDFPALPGANMDSPHLVSRLSHCNGVQDHRSRNCSWKKKKLEKRKKAFTDLWNRNTECLRGKCVYLQQKNCLLVRLAYQVGFTCSHHKEQYLQIFIILTMHYEVKLNISKQRQELTSS